FNVADNLGEWFGVSSPLFHFVASVPVLFSILLPWIWYGVARAVRERNAVSPRDGGGYMLEPLTLAVVTTAIYSLPGHKEYRFLFPILPLGYLYAAKGLLSHVGPLPTPACLSGVLGDDHPDGTSKKDDDARPFPMPPEAAGRLMGGNASKARDSGGGSSSSRRSIPKALPRPQLAWRRVLAFLIAANLPVALYLALLHQSGVVKVMSYLRESASRHQVSSIGFLMPCHSTPFYSHFHHGLPMWFLSCDPYLKETPAELHRWEAQEFEEDPVGFMSLNLISPQNAQGISGSPDARYWPSHLVFFDNKSGVIRDYLKDRGYKECARFFNSLWLPDARRQGDVVVYCGPVTKASDS
ncbi:glycosylphosphatidylinositol anchor biosynthesis, partial [Spiromyces aspiralis]